MPDAASIVDRYREAGLRIATAESCTGGLVAAALTDIAGSSDVFERGFVTYSNEAKQELIGVPAATIAAHGAVSAETAEAMALGALAHSRADVAVSVTGIAGPGGGSADKPVGLVWFGIVRRGSPVRTVQQRFTGDRTTVRRDACSYALTLLKETLGQPALRKSQRQNEIRRAVGIDFSGAKDAGRRIWIAEGMINADGRLVLDRCSSAEDRLNCDRRLNHIMPALVEWIAAQENTIVACDFPFSLPASVILQESWHDFVKQFRTEFRNAKEFHYICHKRSNGREPKRVTDRDAKTPWCAFNLQMFYQTYAGIALLLAPLLGRVMVPPFDRPLLGKPTVVETCPASTLSALGIYKKYGKYKKEQESDIARAKLLAELIDRSLIVVPNVLKERIVANKGGDALDSVIAAIGAVAALPQIDAGIGCNHSIEGWVYYAGGGIPEKMTRSQP